ncbi:MAG: NTP transferase domain-containing protein, partial [Deltaproteobacteria bacterium]|nr:NTP transferase domain-containing protein [Deltaproteobacteria bacterium]
MDLGAIVMAAGLGTRMKSDIPKVLHPLCGKPLLSYVLDLLLQAEVKKIVLVVSHHKEQVRAFVSETYPRAFKGKNPILSLVDQKSPKGTGHAVLVTEKVFKNFTHPIAILSGDVPGLSLKTFEALIYSHKDSQAELTLASAILDPSYPYGRVLRDRNNNITGMIEALDATEEQRQIQEMGVGLYCVNSHALFSTVK